MTKAAKAKAETRPAVADLAEEEGHVSERTPAPKAKNSAPSFRISEGTRDELERNGKATCPFTGRKLTKEDL